MAVNRPQSTLGQLLQPPDYRQRYATVVSVGSGTVYVVMDGGGGSYRMPAIGGIARVGQRVEIVDTAGVLSARVPGNPATAIGGMSLARHASTHIPGGGDTLEDAYLALTGGTITGALQIGSATDYVTLSTTGLAMTGGATTWNDLRVEPTVRSVGSVKAPVYTVIDGTNFYAYLFDNAGAAAEKEVNFKMQLDHSWKVGSAIHIHVHWFPVANGNAGDKVRWGLEYVVVNINGVMGATTTIYAVDPETPPSTTPTAKTHYMTEFAEIDMTGKTLSCFVLGRLFRNSSNAADTYGSDVSLMGIDAHYQQDTLGSTDELVK